MVIIDGSVYSLPTSSLLASFFLVEISVSRCIVIVEAWERFLSTKIYMPHNDQIQNAIREQFLFDEFEILCKI